MVLHLEHDGVRLGKPSFCKSYFPSRSSTILPFQLPSYHLCNLIYSDHNWENFSRSQCIVYERKPVSLTLFYNFRTDTLPMPLAESVWDGFSFTYNLSTLFSLQEVLPVWIRLVERIHRWVIHQWIICCTCKCQNIINNKTINVLLAVPYHGQQYPAEQQRTIDESNLSDLPRSYSMAYYSTCRLKTKRVFNDCDQQNSFE